MSGADVPATVAAASAGASIAPATTMGEVALTVNDLARAQAFYETAIGLVAREGEDGSVALEAPEGPTLVRLYGDAAAPRLDRRATGLYHVAILVPSRPDLARALVRLARARWPLDGASDHLVSEALYLSDPDGNGIEIYRDRPRDQWRHDDGQLQMATLPLDLHDIVRELGDSPDAPPQAAGGTIIGHVHLQVDNLEAAERFYHGLLGFGVTARGYPGALFVSAGGYHHHLGLNTWHSAGSGPAAPGSVGLRSFEVVVPDEPERDRVLQRVRRAGVAIQPAGRPGASAVRDPAGNLIVLRCR